METAALPAELRPFGSGQCIGVILASIEPVAAPAQRRALGALFLFLAVAFAGIAFEAAVAKQWIIVAAAAAIGLWMLGLAIRGLRP